MMDLCRFLFLQDVTRRPSHERRCGWRCDDDQRPGYNRRKDKKCAHSQEKHREESVKWQRRSTQRTGGTVLLNLVL